MCCNVVYKFYCSSKTLLNKTFISDLTTKIDDLAKNNGEILKNINVLADKIETLIASVRTLAETQAWIEKQVVALRKNIIRTEEPVAVNIKHTFPINTEETFKEFLNDIKDPDYQKVMVCLEITRDVGMKIYRQWFSGG